MQPPAVVAARVAIPCDSWIAKNGDDVGARHAIVVTRGHRRADELLRLGQRHPEFARGSRIDTRGRNRNAQFTKNLLPAAHRLKRWSRGLKVPLLAELRDAEG